MTIRRSFLSRRFAQVVATLGVAAFGSAGCVGATVGTGPATSFPSPGEQLDALVAEPPFDRVHWGVLAVDALSGEPVYELNPDLLFIPASNMKLPVTVAALGLLGPDYRWETTFFAHSLPVDGRLDGDLYLPAAGGPDPRRAVPPLRRGRPPGRRGLSPPRRRSRDLGTSRGGRLRLGLDIGARVVDGRGPPRDGRCDGRCLRRGPGGTRDPGPGRGAGGGARDGGVDAPAEEGMRGSLHPSSSRAS